MNVLEYTSRGLVPVLQAPDPFRHLQGRDVALHVHAPAELSVQLHRFVADPPLNPTRATAAHGLVWRERRLAQHAPPRLEIDRQPAQDVEFLRQAAVETAALASTGAFQRDPSDAEALSFRDHCLQRLGRVGEPPSACERASTLDPWLSRPLRSLAPLHRRAALRYIDRAEALNPLDPLPRRAAP